MMHMEHRLSQNLSQRLMLTQKMQQAIQILQLSGIELEQYLQKELEQNPVLEQLVVEPKPETVQPAHACDLSLGWAGLRMRILKLDLSGSGRGRHRAGLIGEE